MLSRQCGRCKSTSIEGLRLCVDTSDSITQGSGSSIQLKVPNEIDKV
jgi:hypothetical protein